MLFPTFRAALASALLLLTSSAPTSAHPSSSVQLQSRQKSNSSSACNNSPDLCGRKYNKVTYMGAHGSSFIRGSSNGISAAGNQFKNATDALDHGLRLLQAQAHVTNTSSLDLCHTSCSLLDAGPLEEWLSTINRWMISNPNEVVTLLLVNYDSAPAADFGSAFERSGLSDIAYVPPATSATSDWPTLQTMIDDNKRLVAFITNINATSNYPYLLPEFDYVFETAFEVTTLTGFNCSLDRPSRAGPAATALTNNYLSLVNHFKYSTLGSDIFVPDVTNIGVVNSAATDTDGNLGKHLKECKAEWGAVPNFVLVDFFDRGDVIKATDDMNGISGATGRSDAGSNGESKTSRNERSLGTGALLAFLAAAVILL